MRRWIHSLLWGILCGGALTAAGFWFFPLSPPPILKIGVLNLSVIRDKSLLFQKSKESIDQQYKRHHETVLKEEEQLRRAYESLQRDQQSGHYAGTDLQKRREALDHEVSKMESLIQEKKEGLALALETMKQEIDQEIREVIQQIGQSLKIDLILNETLMEEPIVIYGAQKFDITPMVLKKLDQRFPHKDPR